VRRCRTTCSSLFTRRPGLAFLTTLTALPTRLSEAVVPGNEGQCGVRKTGACPIPVDRDVVHRDLEHARVLRDEENRRARSSIAIAVSRTLERVRFRVLVPDATTAKRFEYISLHDAVLEGQRDRCIIPGRGHYSVGGVESEPLHRKNDDIAGIGRDPQ
jgi:hypothetical protein